MVFLLLLRCFTVYIDMVEDKIAAGSNTYWIGARERDREVDWEISRLKTQTERRRRWPPTTITIIMVFLFTLLLSLWHQMWPTHQTCESCFRFVLSKWLYSRLFLLLLLLLLWLLTVDSDVRFYLCPVISSFVTTAKTHIYQEEKQKRKCQSSLCCYRNPG